MSIDGPGLLESDLAHDVYNEVMDLWDADVPFDQIRERLRAYVGDDADPLDAEIFLAACTKAFWEIGQLAPDVRDALQAMVDGGTSLAAWADAGDAPLARRRRGVLERLLKQTATPKARPRPRRKYAQIKDKLYAVGDCLVLPWEDRTFFGVVCKLSEHRGQCAYVMIVMAPLRGQTREDFEAGGYFGHFIGTPTGNLPGPHVIRLDHRMLVREGNPFRIVARVALDPARFMPGSFGGVLSMEHVVRDFERTLNDGKPVFGRKRLPLRDLLAS